MCAGAGRGDSSGGLWYSYMVVGLAKQRREAECDATRGFPPLKRLARAGGCARTREALGRTRGAVAEKRAERFSCDCEQLRARGLRGWKGRRAALDRSPQNWV